jgi:peptidyl-prolyl cis-trans isomerase C
LHVRHILFAVAPEVNVHALLVQAERALVELSRPGVAPQRFAELAAELSACPTRAIGGDLGWVGPHDCEPETGQRTVRPAPLAVGHGRASQVDPHRTRLSHHRGAGSAQGPADTLRSRLRASIAGDLAVQRQAMARENSLRSLIAEARVQGIDVNTLLLEESLRFWCHD